MLAAAWMLVAAAWTAPSHDAVARAQHESKSSASLDARIVVVTEPLLGAPYRLSPLGEGTGVDPDPRIRYDAFDCTTSVETSMALALANDLDETARLLDVIRYRSGHPDYLDRRHFPEAEWIPELVQLGFLRDITREVGGADVVVETKKLDASVWKQAKHAGIPTLPDARIPNGVFSLNVWPLAKAQANLDRIPSGTLLDVVRVDFSSVPVRVSHQGIVVVHNGKRYMRHAADRMFHAVVDEPLDHFLSRMEDYAKWPVAGIHLARIQEPPAWRALLAPQLVVEPGSIEAPHDRSIAKRPR